MLSEYQRPGHEKLSSRKNFKSTPKLIPTVYDKKEYTTHERNLKQCLEMGLKLTKVHEIVEFEIQLKFEMSRFVLKLMVILKLPTDCLVSFR